MNNDRDTLLVSKMQEIEAELARWCKENDILGTGEKLKFRWRVSSDPGVKLREKARMLPPDEKRKGSEARTVWRLLEEDWNMLAKLQWDEDRRSTFELLRTRNNEPIEISVEGTRERKRFTGGFNDLLRKTGGYDTLAEKGCYYRFVQVIPGSGFYAIMKHGYC